MQSPTSELDEALSYDELTNIEEFKSRNNLSNLIFVAKRPVTFEDCQRAHESAKREVENAENQINQQREENSKETLTQRSEGKEIRKLRAQINQEGSTEGYEDETEEIAMGDDDNLKRQRKKELEEKIEKIAEKKKKLEELRRRKKQKLEELKRKSEENSERKKKLMEEKKVCVHNLFLFLFFIEVKVWEFKTLSLLPNHALCGMTKSRICSFHNVLCLSS